MLTVSRTSHNSKEAVLEPAGRGRKLIRRIRKLQMEFVGHGIRKDGVEKSFLTGKIDGRRDRGRQGLTFLRSLGIRAGVKTLKLLSTHRDRIAWHCMVAKVVR